MKSFLLRRVVSLIITVILITALTFTMMHSIPGGPFTREKSVPPEILKHLNAKYNLDDPIPLQ